MATGHPIDVGAFTRVCGWRAGQALAPMLEAAGRRPEDACLESSLRPTRGRPSEASLVTVRLKSRSGSRADFQLVQSGTGDHGHAFYVGVGGVVHAYEPIGSDEDARELSGILRELLASPVRVTELRMDGELYKAMYVFDDEDGTRAPFVAIRPRLFGRTEQTRRLFAPW